MKKLVMAFSGPSNSGKTTLILKVIDYFKQRNLNVCVLKHDPSNKAKFDIEGKDSFKFSKTGANVVVLSPTRTTYFLNYEQSIDDIIKNIGDFDIFLVEGLKTLNLPRISVFKDEIDESYFEFSNAIASIHTQKDYGIKNLDLNNIDEICQWILSNAKRIN